MEFANFKIRFDLSLKNTCSGKIGTNSSELLNYWYIVYKKD
jgi:hypothetical protein